MADRTETEKRNLAEELAAAVRGEVSFAAADRALMTMDASNYRRVPRAVVAPKDADDVAAALRVCREHGVPVVPRGGGTSIAGQATGVGVVLDFTRHMRRIVSLDAAARTAVVQPGVVLDDLRAAAARARPDLRPRPVHPQPLHPRRHDRQQLLRLALGGLGHHRRQRPRAGAADVRRRAGAGRPRHGPDRRPDRTAPAAAGRRQGPGGRASWRCCAPASPTCPAGSPATRWTRCCPRTGADLARAFSGSEGTLGVLTEATVRLVEAPRARALAVLGYPDESAAAEAAAALLPHRPLTVEGMAADLVRATRPDCPGAAPGCSWRWAARAAAEARGARRGARAGRRPRTAPPTTPSSPTRPASAPCGGSARTPPAPRPGCRTAREAWPGWEDCAVPPARLGPYLRDFRALLTAARPARHPVRALRRRLHPRPYRLRPADRAGHPPLPATSPTTWRELVVAHGGSLSGEHGDGQARAELLPKMYGAGAGRPLRAVQGALGPGRPGSTPACSSAPPGSTRTSASRCCPSARSTVEFGYPHDGGDFSAAVRRCVGVAKCRNAATGPGSTDVMCPSFRATGEEQHSTRGRARLLHEMLAGEVITDGWRSHGGARRARPVPVLQGLPQRLPGRGRHGHVQGGVPAPPLRGPAAPRRALLDGPAAGVAATAARPRRARRSTPSRRTTAGRRRQTARRDRARAADPASWPPRRSPAGGGGRRKAGAGGAAVARRASGHVRRRLPGHLPRRPTSPRPAARSSSGPTPSPTTSPRRSAGPPYGSWKPPDCAALLPPTAPLRPAGARSAAAPPPPPVCCGLTYVSTGQLDRPAR